MGDNRHPKKLEDRFWAKVQKTPHCWLWVGGSAHPYGLIATERIRAGRWRTELVNRVSWKIAYGAIPDGAEVCHRCDNTRCVRPSHLFLGTHAQNMSDMRRKGRAVALRGAAHANAKLSDAQVVEIVQQHRSRSMKIKQMCLLYNVSVGTVVSIVSGNGWRHVVKGTLRMRPRNKPPAAWASYRRGYRAPATSRQNSLARARRELTQPTRRA